MSRRAIFILIAVVLAVAAGAGYYFLFSSKPGPTSPVVAVADKSFGWKFPTGVALLTKTPSGSGQNLFDFQIAFSNIRDPGGIPRGLPVRLQVPIIGVDSAIEDAAITPDGRMDVPAGSVNVAWFALGPHPGQVGSAVIGGHFGIQNGVPFVFYNLDKLKIGDKIYIVDDTNATLAFQVRSIASFDRNADATAVFTSSDGLAHLNLITCEGVWNQVNGTYPRRLVVFTDAIPSEGPVTVSASVANTAGTAAVPSAGAVATFNRSLTIGTQGQDVAALQTALVQKGFLALPPGVGKGIFGALTRAAVAKYQASEGLVPSIGYFGPLTRARLIAELGSSPILPNTGSGTTTTSTGLENKPTPPQTFIRSVLGLFATPFDGIMTSLLLALIALTAIKIIRR
jgi:LPXTG-site transpeptidase (sortase) family protein